MAEKTVELAPGESKEVAFEAIPHEAKTYQVSINGLTGSFKAIPFVPLEIQGFTLNGRTHATVSPRSRPSARVLVRANQDISFSDALIYFGKGYDKGTEPQPLPAPEGYREAVIDYLFKGDQAFLALPILGKYDWTGAGWAPLIIYFNGHSQWRGSTNPWYYSSGHSTWDWGVEPFSLTPGEHSLAFPRPDRPPAALFLPVKVSDEIKGTVDALVLVGSYWVIFKDILTISTSSYNPEQVTVTTWISNAMQPVREPIKAKVGLNITGLGSMGFNPDMVLEAPRRSPKLVTTKDLDPRAIETVLTAADAGVALNLNTFHKVFVPETLDVEQEVDVALCQEYGIRIDRAPGISTIFEDKGAIELWLVKRRSDVASVELMQNLLQLSVGDTCLGLGINPDSITFPSNDVFINGRKIAGVEVHPDELYYTGVLFCNIDINPELAEAALKGKVRASDITSISAELGKPVSESAFRQLLLESLSRTFNLEIHR